MQTTIFIKANKQNGIPSTAHPTVHTLFSQPTLCLPFPLASLISASALSIPVVISGMWVLSACNMTSPNWYLP